jgi:ferric-dicitrate binding protein FerR (iron transport regulator)
MGWVSSKRFEDHVRAQDQQFAASSREHRQLRKSIEKLDKTTKSKLENINANVDERHRENKRLAVKIALIVLGAYATSYFAQHGLTIPLGVPQVVAVTK